jgi:hypothetical protein
LPDAAIVYFVLVWIFLPLSGLCQPRAPRSIGSVLFGAQQ